MKYRSLFTTSLNCLPTKAVQQETDKKIAVLKNSFENCKQMYDVYMDIAKNYYDISKGDYVSKLIKDWHKRQPNIAKL